MFFSRSSLVIGVLLAAVALYAGSSHADDAAPTIEHAAFSALAAGGVSG